jgi:sirohydrochlorin ferrochelatase
MTLATASLPFSLVSRRSFMRRWARHSTLLFMLTIALLAGRTAGAQDRPTTGILLMAHGGSAAWNDQVRAVAKETDGQMPTEIAFGMADRSTLQQGIDALTTRGVTAIVAVPLFVSSHSSVIESTKYLLGLRPDAPEDLAAFASMSGMGHGSSGAHAAAGHDMAAPATDDGKDANGLPRPVTSTVPIRMSPALDRHPIVADILIDRSAAFGKDPSHEALILVAHGPNDDAENAEWLADMAALAQRVKTRAPYARIDSVTLRDDAEPAVRDRATADLRKAVQSANDAGYRVLVTPLLLSYGGIENGLRQRLDGLQHALSPQALLPDARIARWVLESARPADSIRK